LLIEFERLGVLTTYTQSVPVEHGREQVFKRCCFVAKNHNEYKYRKFFEVCQGKYAKYAK